MAVVAFISKRKKSGKGNYLIILFQVPDSFGVVKDVVLGFDDLEGYVNRNKPYLGATVGRCANRIGNASFEIDGKTYPLATNNLNKHHLHGGVVGFDKVCLNCP